MTTTTYKKIYSLDMLRDEAYALLYVAVPLGFTRYQGMHIAQMFFNY